MFKNQFQIVRLFDMVVLSPYLIYKSTDKRLNKFDQAAFLTIGTGTFLYNLGNFINELKTSEISN